MSDINILVVEDEIIEAMDIKRTLESIGYQVPHVASSGQEAIDKALELKPDLILMDIILKGEIDGIEAISKIKALDIPFIYLTAHSEESTIERAKLTEPSGYIIKPFDSTELKYAIELAIYKNKMDTSLKNNEALFRTMVDSAPVAILVSVGVEEKVEFMNTRFTELFGYTIDDVPDVAHWWPLAYPDIEYRQKMEQVWTKRLEKAMKYKTEVEPVPADITCKDGTIKNVEVKLSSMGEKNLVFFTDLTHHKKTEDALRDSEERLKMGMDIANLAYWEYDVKSDMFSFNDQFYKLYGTTEQEEGSYHMSSQEYATRFIPPEESRLVAEEIANALETDDPDYFSTVQHSIIRADGTKRFMIIRFIVVKDENGQTIKTIGVNQDITELKLAEEDLKISENRYRAVFENSGTPILTFNSQGTILMVNSEWERVSGYSRKEVEGKMTWIELVHPDYREMMIKYHQERLKETDPVTNKYETAFVNKNGVKLFMYVTVVKVPGTDNWLASALDITDLKTTQKSLKRNVLRFRALAENAIDGIITIDAHGNILYFNNSLMKIFGYNQDELESSKLTRLMPERYRKSFTESLKKFRTTGEHRLEGRTIETLGLKEDGTEFPFEMSLTKWEIEEEIYFTAIIRDITERKKAEIALIKSEGLLRGVFDNMPNGMAVYHVKNDGSNGSDYIIKEFNHTSQEMEGMSREEVIGKSLSDIRPNIDDYGLISVFKKVWESGVPIHYPAKIYVDEKYANWYENYVFKTSTGEIVAIYNDVTEQQVAKEKIQKSLDEKEVLLREIHHRVQNNMQIISSLLNLQKQFVEDKEADNVLFESQNRVKSLAMIHERLYQSHDLTHIDISAYIERLVADLFYSYNIPPEQVTRKIEIDDLRLNIETAVPCGIIISEIVSNSLKYAFPDGKEGELIVSLKASDEFNELIISDNGIGFPKELDFKNTKTLGLQLVYNLVKQLDGEITLDRSHGTKFRITFKELEYEQRI